MYKGGDDLKTKLQQLRDGMGYYDQNKPGGGNGNGNNSVLLPELKSITPSIVGQKQQH